MNIRKRFAIISYGLVLAMILTSCGGAKADAPELVAPVAVNESCRPVEKGSIGNIQIKNGVVVPTDYCHFYLTSVKVADIKVEVGDYVEAGTVLAVADSETSNKQIEQLSGEQSRNQKAWDLQCKIYEQNKKELEYKIKGAKENADSELEKVHTTALAVLEENHKYDEIFYNHQQKKLGEKIADQQKVANDGTLVATHSGYVTYIKDLADSEMVNVADNVVIISDYEDCYIELIGVTKDDKLDKIYPAFYTVLGGNRCMLKEYEYLPEELMAAQARSLKPTLRMKFEDEDLMPEIGNNIPVYFQKEIIDDVLIVGNDSLYEDEQGDFVYVKNGEKKEIRYVELGEADTFYTEVVSGLSEGELVYYSSDSVLPEEYVEYTVEYDNFVSLSESDYYSIKDTSKRKCFSEYEGVIESVAVTQGDQVSVGQLICVIRTNEGSATLTEMYNGIVNYKASHVETIKGMNQAIEEKENEVEAAYNAKKEASTKDDVITTPTDAIPTDATSTDATLTDATATDGTPVPEEKVSPYLYEELCCQLEVLKLNKQLAELNYVYQLATMENQYSEVSCNNDGNGAINVYALNSGKIMNLNIKEGKNIEVGNRLFNIEIPSGKLVELRSKDALFVNQTVKFVNGDNTYEGKVVGNNGNDGSFYFTHIDGRVYISASTDSKSANYYISMDNKQFYDLDKNYEASYPVLTINNSVVVPGTFIYLEEKIKSGVGTVTYTYVWKIVDGELVKQYVQCIGGTPGGSKSVCVVSGLKAGDVLAVEADAIPKKTEE